MSPAWRWFWIVAAFWLAAVLDQSLSPAIAIAGGSPSFLLVVASCLALRSSPRGGAFAGFLSGVIYGAMSGANITHYAVGRLLSCLALSQVGRLGLRSGIPLTVVSVAASTAVSGLFLILFAPPPELGAALGATMVGALYNGVLAAPLCRMLSTLVASTTDLTS